MPVCNATDVMLVRELKGIACKCKKIVLPPPPPYYIAVSTIDLCHFVHVTERSNNISVSGIKFNGVNMCIINNRALKIGICGICDMEIIRSAPLEYDIFFLIEFLNDASNRYGIW